jgi:hypothetical protein
MESLESILADLNGKYKDPNSGKQDNPKQRAESLPSKPTSLDSLMDDLRSNSQAHISDYMSQSTRSVAANQAVPAIERDLKQVADRQNMKDHQEIAQKATKWLQNLDPLCGEGLWFEEFAKNYSSRLEAAIALISSK